MAYTGKPVFHFVDTAETGVIDLGLEALVFLESNNKIYTKVNGTGLTGTSTIQNAIDDGNLVEVSGGGGSSFLYQYEFKATAGQTVFNCTYNPSFIYISLAGVDLADNQYTAIDGTTVVLNDPADVGEVVRIYSASNAGSIPGLKDLPDTDINNPTDGQILVYNIATTSWENVTPDFGNLDSDGTIPMDVGYAPVNDQDIATKVSVTEEIITRLEANMLFDAGLFGGYQQ